MSEPVTTAEGITNPPIDELLERTQSKYALVIIAAKRARQINAYYSQLGDGLLVDGHRLRVVPDWNATLPVLTSRWGRSGSLGWPSSTAWR